MKDLLVEHKNIRLGHYESSPAKDRLERLGGTFKMDISPTSSGLYLFSIDIIYLFMKDTNYYIFRNPIKLKLGEESA